MEKTKAFIEVWPGLRSEPEKECACVCAYLRVRGSKGGKKKERKKASGMAASAFCISVRLDWHSNKVC